MVWLSSNWGLCLVTHLRHLIQRWKPRLRWCACFLIFFPSPRKEAISQFPAWKSSKHATAAWPTFSNLRNRNRRGYKLLIWPLKANASAWKINQKDWILHSSHLDGHLWRFWMPAFVGRVTVPHLKVQDSDAIAAIQNLCVTRNLLPLTLFTAYPTNRTVKAQNRGACTWHICALIIFSYSPESFMYPTLAVEQKKVEESELFRVACIPAPRFFE